MWCPFGDNNSCLTAESPCHGCQRHNHHGSGRLRWCSFDDHPVTAKKDISLFSAHPASLLCTSTQEIVYINKKDENHVLISMLKTTGNRSVHANQPLTYLLDGQRLVLNPVSVSLSERGIHAWIRWVPPPEKKP
jgi:hypothetical protein